MLKIRRVRLEAQTQLGLVGTSLEFRDGLNVLRADNSSGKSTCLQAIIYGLGLEGMLSARRDIPLPHSMTDQVEVGERIVGVDSSRVLLVAENGNGQVITVQRVVKDSSLSTALVRVWPGDTVDPHARSGSHRDFFVRRSGSAQRSDGFHFFLASFLGWRLPPVTKMDGTEAILYLEALFPYFYIEQKHGWSGIQARMPTYLGIRDIGKRSTEFILNLDVYDLSLKRQRLTSAGGELQQQWRDLVRRIQATAQRTGAVVSNLPDRIVRTVTSDQIQFQIADGDDWRDLSSMLSIVAQRKADTEAVPVRSSGADAEREEGELRLAQAQLSENTVLLNVAIEDLDQINLRLRSLNQRIEALEEDLQKHKDAGLLERLGSSEVIARMETSTCPTCHQELGDAHELIQHGMTIEENTRYIEEQLHAFRGLRDDSMRSADAHAARIRSIRELLRENRNQVRSLKESLTSAAGAPSLADVRARVALEDRVETLTAVSRELAGLRVEAQELAKRWSQNQDMLATLSTDATDNDKLKLSALRDSIRRQVQRYSLSSIRPDEVDISDETYRPVREGFDLGFDLSASDMIRVIWAYLMGMLSIGYRQGNHAGLLILDEPRQQETAWRSYRELIREASETARQGVQLIFATSQSQDELRAMLADTSHHLIDIRPGAKLLDLIAR